MLQTSEKEPSSVNINMECVTKQVRYPPSGNSISNRLHMKAFIEKLHQGWGSQQRRNSKETHKNEGRTMHISDQNSTLRWASDL